MRAPLFAAVGLCLVQTSCNTYDLFRVAGYQQETFTNRADVLFVIDNSESMVEEAESLAVNFASFIDGLESVRENRTFDGLTDAVGNYLEETQLITGAVDYQLAVTTTSAGDDAGGLVGPVVSRTSDNLVQTFLEGLTCNATCFGGAPLPRDPNYRCGDPPGAFLSEEYMDCLCGGTTGRCGGAVEEGLESTFLAMCRAVDNPPRACFEDVLDDDGNVLVTAELRDSDRDTNQGMLRPNANFIVVVVSDEGDNSRRLLDREEIPDEYERLFSQFNVRMTWVYIGPSLNEAQTDLTCPGTGSDFGVIRYNYMVFTTSGRSVDIFDEDCDTRDFGEALSELGELLRNLATSFPLQSVPVQDSITVIVDGHAVKRAENLGAGPFGLDEYSDGWSYRASDNSVQFWGNAIPGYEAVVEVYYKPIDGIPRDLPF